MKSQLRKYGFWVAIFVFGVLLGRMSVLSSEKHFPPRYGKSTGLPANCSAYVDTAIAGYRSRMYSADDTMVGLERNCGAGGQLWRD